MVLLVGLCFHPASVTAVAEDTVVAPCSVLSSASMACTAASGDGAVDDDDEDDEASGDSAVGATVVPLCNVFSKTSSACTAAAGEAAVEFKDEAVGDIATAVAEAFAPDPAVLLPEAAARAGVVPLNNGPKSAADELATALVGIRAAAASVAVAFAVPFPVVGTVPFTVGDVCVWPITLILPLNVFMA